MAQWQFIISPNALSLISMESRARYPKETGGILIGWQDGNIFSIEIAIGPGPKAVHKRNSFTRDGDFSQVQLDRIVTETQGRCDYLGEWHSHPKKMGPSIKDISSLKKVKTDSSYNISNPILGLYIFQTRVWDFNCYTFQNDDELVNIKRL